MSVIHIRRQKASDAEEVEKMAANYNGENPVPETFETAAVAQHDNGDVIAIGMLRSNVEVLLYTQGRDKEKVEAIQKLFEIAVGDAKKLGHTKIYMFSDTEAFARICEKHFKFRRINAIPLILELD